MFYVKHHDHVLGLSIKMDITDENVFTSCPECGMEQMVDIVELAKGEFDLFGTALLCQKCSRLRRSAAMNNAIDVRFNSSPPE